MLEIMSCMMRYENKLRLTHRCFYRKCPVGGSRANIINTIIKVYEEYKIPLKMQRWDYLQ